uniref:Antitoxin FitA-like ribbon-helix-helix domain-containing protein n=1 Tax=Candidatus Kentrum sp. FM TaxID=2126340 RepID=A0A450S6L1_9GAMM|nr:MAG: hypothetical protein BECKFM1743A_GA0114220_100464 [Candidatus Kentron sp. FM]VFJ47532.1 MAG: hypothetical protein BECKFM1743C_GA0114222_100464 [Candidatus Kentron sp. FM]VFK07808.1 MAG: hypothetical protein BECKFM1743B_GA0114221_100518 [Candidatus Kentron sp. FM]
MAQMMIRNLDSDVKEHLKKQAIGHGWSMEQEAREILRSVLIKKEPSAAGLGSRIAARFTGIGLDEDLPEMRGQTIVPMDLYHDRP